MKEEYINIHKKSLNGNCVQFEVYSPFFAEENSYLIKFNPDMLCLTFERASLDYQGKVYNGHRRNNSIKFTFGTSIPIGKFGLCHEESNEDLLVFYLDEPI